MGRKKFIIPKLSYESIEKHNLLDWEETKYIDLPHIKQFYSYDCGVSMSDVILSYYGFNTLELKLFEELQPNKVTGTSPRNIIRLFKKMGLKVSQGLLTLEDLRALIDKNIPILIVLQAYPKKYPTDWSTNWDDGHYVVVKGYTEGGFIFSDSSSIYDTYLTNEQLEERWHDLCGRRRLNSYGIIAYGKTPTFSSSKVINMDANIHQIDYKKLTSEILTSVKTYKKYETKILGEVYGKSIYLIRPKILNPNLNNILIVSGFHGEEVAGPWGVHEYLTTYNLNELALRCNVSFIPIVNVDGFCMGNRYNRREQSSNRGFLSGSLSKEGKILTNHFKELIELSKQGFLTLHESILREEYYLYAYQDHCDYELINSLVKVAKKIIKTLPNGTYLKDTIDEFTVKNGVVLNPLSDDSYEDYLSKKGTEYSITSETPILKASFEDRVKVNADILKTFIRFFSENT